mmetsp:Transcript_8093/g.26912  ORF Transcript_8093/g.26912 Transcript_8093/m.26912 type:complete len:321 (-) Transcript_8093:124-1086(-)
MSTSAKRMRLVSGASGAIRRSRRALTASSTLAPCASTAASHSHGAKPRLRSASMVRSPLRFWSAATHAACAAASRSPRSSATFCRSAARFSRLRSFFFCAFVLLIPPASAGARAAAAATAAAAGGSGGGAAEGRYEMEEPGAAAADEDEVEGVVGGRGALLVRETGTQGGCGDDDSCSVEPRGGDAAADARGPPPSGPPGEPHTPAGVGGDAVAGTGTGTGARGGNPPPPPPPPRSAADGEGVDAPSLLPAHLHPHHSLQRLLAPVLGHDLLRLAAPDRVSRDCARNAEPARPSLDLRRHRSAPLGRLRHRRSAAAGWQK